MEVRGRGEREGGGRAEGGASPRPALPIHTIPPYNCSACAWYIHAHTTRPPPYPATGLPAGVPMALKPTSQHLLRCKWADDVRFEVRPALAVARAVADALRYCHGKGVCHGDVYGHNVLVDEDMHATLCDFGEPAAEGEAGRACAPPLGLLPRLVGMVA